MSSCESLDALHGTTPDVFASLLKQVEFEHWRQLKDVRSASEREIQSLIRQLNADQSSSPESRQVSPGAEQSFLVSSENAGAEGNQVDISIPCPTSWNSPRQVCLADPLSSMQVEIGRERSSISKSRSAQSEASNFTQEKSQHVMHHYLTGMVQKHMLSNRSHSTDVLKRMDNSFRHRFAPVHRSMETIVLHPYFETVCVSMILLNATFIAAATEHEAQNPGGKLPWVYKLASRFFTAWFFIELLARCTAVGLYAFFFTRGIWAWNVFDIVVVAADLAQLLMSFLVDDFDKSAMNSTTFRILRILRAVRVMRILKLVAFFTEFRLMVMSVLQSGLVLFWCGLFLLMIMFIFAIFITQSIARHVADADPAHNQEQVNKLKKRFGCLSHSLYSLFLTISGGVSWEEIAEPLFDVDVILGPVYILYVFFAVFSMVNIINAIFVNTVLTSAQNDAEEVVRARMQEYESALRKLAEAFTAADTDQSQTLKFEEFETHLRDQHALAQLQSIGISVEEACSMFNLLDSNGDGEITPDEFVFGCLRIKGAAKTIDLQTLMVENKKLSRTFVDFRDLMFCELQDLKQLQRRIDDQLGLVSREKLLL